MSDGSTNGLFAEFDDPEIQEFNKWIAANPQFQEQPTATPTQPLTEKPWSNPQMSTAGVESSLSQPAATQDLGPLYRAEAYGPALGETSYDQTHGPLGQLKSGQLAVSKNMADRHPMGSYANVVDQNGNVILPNMQVADWSYKKPGVPNTNTFEVWNGADIGQAHLVAIPAPTGTDQTSSLLNTGLNFGSFGQQ